MSEVSAPSSNNTIMIIDDDPSWNEVIAHALGRLGWERVHAVDQAAAVREAIAVHAPDIVLLDLFLEDGASLDLLSELRRERPEIRVIVVTVSDEVEHAVDCMRRGAIDYLTKPVKRQALLDALGRAAEPRAGHRHLVGTRTNPRQNMARTTLADALPDLRVLPHLKAAPVLLIEEALRRSDGVIKKAAVMLGVSPQAICNRRRRGSFARR